MSLDTAFRQVLVEAPLDPTGLIWHHRLLLVKGEGSKWIAADPEHEVEVLDLSTVRVIAVRRAAPWRVDLVGQIYAFDQLVPGVEDDLRVRAAELAELVGFPMAEVTEEVGDWYVADPASALFGVRVPAAALAVPAAFVTRGSKGLAEVDGEWLAIERVLGDQLQKWKEDKWFGPGRAPGLGPLRRDATGKPFIAEAEAMSLWRAPKGEPVPLRGVRVSHEFFANLLAAGFTLTSHDGNWRRTSGVPERGIVARFHSAVTEVLRMMLSVDQLDPNHIICAELLVRYLVLIESATARNPKAPDWEGLDLIVNATMSSAGQVEVPKFNEWLSQVQRDTAQVMKQGRLLREERQAEAKRKGDKPKKDGKEDPP